MKSPRTRETYDISGTVQGVGFRPTLFNLARQSGLCGWVQNRSGTVRLVLEGDPSSIRNFISSLPDNVPANSLVKNISLVSSERPDRENYLVDFRIIESISTDNFDLVIPADLAICRDCADDIYDSENRRYRYAFTTCTCCGPRYTLINDTPYDRVRTTMACFPLCESCTSEYNDPGNRRFHAESIACPACGPKLVLQDIDGTIMNGDPLRETRKIISSGGIVAVRGIGGYLLAADAHNRKALEVLRERKNRPDKPFALMARNIESLRQYCQTDAASEALLTSPEAPIVILDIKNKPDTDLPYDLISPDTMTLGVMLPTSPLHMLLFDNRDDIRIFDLLIMTSGNRGGEPTCTTNAEAFDRLQGIADFMLSHNREINLRNDDSICIVRDGQPQIWRRARGYAPYPVAIHRTMKRNILAMGAELKNTIALGFKDTIVLSPHIGDLETPEAINGLGTVLDSLPAFLKISPDAVATDLHPDMHSTIEGIKLARRLDVPIIRIQHHHAHAAACLAENKRETGLALVLDGTGLGADNSIWGAELMSLNGPNYRRMASFSGVPLPGADKAVKYPYRQIAGRWFSAGIKPGDALLKTLNITPSDMNAWLMQCEKRLMSPVTHSAGRLFDSLSAILGFAPGETTYEAQAAIRLEAAAMNHNPGPELPFTQEEDNDILYTNWNKTFEMLSDQKYAGKKNHNMAMSAHHAIAKAVVIMVEYAFSRSPERTVALSGGVFMNRLLSGIVKEKLGQLGAEVLIHRHVPPNDACISFGQAVIAGYLDIDGNGFSEKIVSESNNK